MVVKKLGFVIPIYSQFKLALETIDSIRTAYPHRVYIERNYIENKGVAAAWNSGIKNAINEDCDLIFILNDDIILGRDTVDHMVSLIEENDDIAVLTGCDHRNTHTPQDVFGMEFPGYEIDLIDAPDFACFVIPNWAVEVVGWFDTNFHPAYFEDNDYVYRTLLAGLKPVRSQNSPFYHYGSQTQNGSTSQPVVPPEKFRVNRQYFVDKWGGEPGSEVYTHPFNDPNKTLREF